jgi:hypothetical protein
MPAGRPTDYRDEYIDQAQKLSLLGATDIELADFFGINVSTLNRWKITYPEFCAAIKDAKAVADAKVVRSLFQRATGFEHDAVKVGFDKSGNAQYAPYREFIVPDTAACIFWLKNRDKENWRDKIDQELTGKDGGPIQASITVEFVKTGNAGH